MWQYAGRIRHFPRIPVQRRLVVTRTTAVRTSASLVKNLNIKPHNSSSIIRFAHRSTSKMTLPALKTMKLESEEFRSLFTPELQVLTDLFSKYGHEIRIAGGAVRDLLLEMLPHDVDFATTATPDEMKKMFEKENIRMINAKGEKHGTITCRINDKENFEVTTLRIDVVTDGRHAEVEFTRDWQLDALRRDLTVNSMFLGFDGTVYDYFEGQRDLKLRKIRFVGDPVDRIQEDYLRILRYFRFYGRIATDPDGHEEETLTAIRENMHGLAGISGERLWVELKKIFVGNHANSLIPLMLQLGMAKFIGLPRDVNLAEFARVWQRCHHLDPQPMTLIAALLHSEAEVYSMNERLKVSKDELRTAAFIILHREDELQANALRSCQDLMCDTVGKEPRTKNKIYELLKYVGEEKTLNEFMMWELPRFPVSGHRLIEMGVKKGPVLAKTLAALRQKWKESNYDYTEDDLIAYVEELKKTIT